MKNKRVLQFALAGLLMALALQLIGYRMDHTVPRIALGNQGIYNWLTLLFSPVAFFLRFGNPEAPIVAGWGTLLAVLSSNVFLYAAFCKAGQLFLARLQQKLVRENIPLMAQRHPERVIRLTSPQWKPRRA
ncbi:MAG TPA: hypothetical protein VE263_17530 [Candidatus Angelobacter sp.]|nr:hypothetical protein [Candidatus Angelobacter sp.]